MVKEWNGWCAPAEQHALTVIAFSVIQKRYKSSVIFFLLSRVFKMCIRDSSYKALHSKGQSYTEIFLWAVCKDQVFCKRYAAQSDWSHPKISVETLYSFAKSPVSVMNNNRHETYPCLTQQNFLNSWDLREKFLHNCRGFFKKLLIHWIRHKPAQIHSKIGHNLDHITLLKAFPMSIKQRCNALLYSLALSLIHI